MRVVNQWLICNRQVLYLLDMVNIVLLAAFEVLVTWNRMLEVLILLHLQVLLRLVGLISQDVFFSLIFLICMYVSYVFILPVLGYRLANVESIVTLVLLRSKTNQRFALSVERAAVVFVWFLIRGLFLGHL